MSTGCGVVTIAALRDVSELHWPALAEALASAGLGPEDAAAVRVAKRLAQVIDEARDQEWAMRWLMPNYLAALDALGLTPQARAALTKGQKPAQDKPNGLAKLRAAK